MKLRQSIRVFVVLAGAMLPVITSSPAMASMMLKGGTTRFTSGLDKVTAPGVTWGLLYSFKPASFVAVETGSEGSRNVLNDPASPETTALLRLGETTLVKFILPVLPVVHPFVGAGLAVDYIIVQGSQLSFSVPGIPGQSDARYSSGMFVHFPLAAGIEFDFSAVTLGVRATYHYSAASPFPKGINPNFLDLAATVGVAF
jgi:hypothetical protein